MIKRKILKSTKLNDSLRFFRTRWIAREEKHLPTRASRATRDECRPDCWRDAKLPKLAGGEPKNGEPRAFKHRGYTSNVATWARHKTGPSFQAQSEKKININWGNIWKGERDERRLKKRGNMILSCLFFKPNSWRCIRKFDILRQCEKFADCWRENASPILSNDSSPRGIKTIK